MVIALLYFGGGVALGVHSGEWMFWMGRGTPEENSMYSIPQIVSSTAAAAVSDMCVCVCVIC